ncbi:IS1404 transposase [Xanthomonas fragariae]|nr:IS1404 transposase [Xanthomonas fragariae]
MKKRFTEEQIIGFLREAEAGVAIKDLCRRHGFSEASYYLWRSKFDGMSVPDAKRLKDLESENARLKKLLAEQLFENDLRCEKSGERTGASCAGARVDRVRCQRASRLGGDRHERQCAALLPARRPQR